MLYTDRFSQKMRLELGVSPTYNTDLISYLSFITFIFSLTLTFKALSVFESCQNSVYSFLTSDENMELLDFIKECPCLEVMSAGEPLTPSSLVLHISIRSLVTITVSDELEKDISTCAIVIHLDLHSWPLAGALMQSDLQKCFISKYIRPGLGRSSI